MPVVPLGTQAYERNDGFTPEVSLVNMFLEKDESGISPDNTLRLQRPGLLTIASVPESIRGVEYFTGKGTRLIVAGSKLYENEAPIGNTPGAGPAIIATSIFGAVIVSGGQAFFYDNVVVTPLTVPDLHTPVSVDTINNYFLILCSDGRFYWIVPGEKVIDPLNYATAESSADAGTSIKRLTDEFWIFGSQTTEVWQATGNADAPFQRVGGRQYERGCIFSSTVCRFDNSIVWVGDDGNVYRGGPQPIVISTPAIAERIRKFAGGMTAWVFGVDGHRFYVLDIVGQGTFAYDASTGSWSEFRSPNRQRWDAFMGYEANGQVIAVSVVDGRVWRLSANSADDDGIPFLRLVTGTVPVGGPPGRNDSLTIGTGTSADCDIRVRWKDGQEDFPDYYEYLTALSPIDQVSLYRLGQPMQPYRTFEVSTLAPTRVRFSGMLVNQAWK